MAENLLAWLQFPVGEGAFYSVLGFAFVFVGILILITIIWLIGKVMGAFDSSLKPPKDEKPKAEEKKVVSVPAPAPVVSEGVTEEELAVITASIMAYYEGTKQNCEFVVRRIKRI